MTNAIDRRKQQAFSKNKLHVIAKSFLLFQRFGGNPRHHDNFSLSFCFKNEFPWNFCLLRQSAGCSTENAFSNGYTVFNVIFCANHRTAKNLNFEFPNCSHLVLGRSVHLSSSRRLRQEWQVWSLGWRRFSCSRSWESDSARYQSLDRQKRSAAKKCDFGDASVIFHFSFSFLVCWAADGEKIILHFQYM